MKTDRAILGSFALFVLIGAFWMLVLSPKRKEATELADQKAQLQQSINDQEAVATFAEQARKAFPKYYGRLVVLGKAVPEQADTASLLVQLSKISADSHVNFRTISLGTGTSTAATAAPPPTSPAEAAPTATDAPAEPGSTTETTTADTSTTTDTTATTTTATAATEAAASTLPIGASIGSAGLPTLPYDLTFTGHFFDIADFIGGIDGLVDTKSGGQVGADGRLLTIDGFSLTADPDVGFPKLKATFVVTAYSTPSAEGLTLGASPTAPAITAPQTTTTSTTVSP